MEKFWRKEMTVSSGAVFVAEIHEGFVYDAAGNLTQDGRWVYSWEARIG